MSKPCLLFVRYERDLVVRAEEGDRVEGSYEVGGWARLEECVVAVCVTITMPPLLTGLENVGCGGGEDGDWDAGGRGGGDRGRRKGGNVFEDVFGIEELGVDVLGGKESGADYEDFCGDVTMNGWMLGCTRRGSSRMTNIPGRRRLRCLDLGEELAEHPKQVVVVLTSEDLGHKCSAFDKELHSQFQTAQHELGLRESILHPCTTDIRSTIVEYDISLPVFHMRAEELATFCASNIGGEGSHMGDRANRDEIDTCLRGEEVSGVKRNRWHKIGNSPIIKLLGGIYLLATCSQPPGAAQRSITHRADSRNSNFLFNWMSLKAERAR